MGLFETLRRAEPLGLAPYRLHQTTGRRSAPRSVPLDLTPYALTAPSQRLTRTRYFRPLTQHLVNAGLLTPANARRAERVAQMQAAQLHPILFADHGISHLKLAEAEASLCNTIAVNPVRQPPDPTLVTAFGAQAGLQRQLLPWRKAGDCTIVLTSQPTTFERHRSALEATFGTVRMAITTQDQLEQAVRLGFAQDLVRAAETRLPVADSSRTWDSKAARRWSLTILAAVALVTYLAPLVVFTALCAWVVGLTALNAGFKATALIAGRKGLPTPPDNPVLKYPTITLLVPLFREKDIAAHLIRRLEALDYPRALLDVCLVLEADDKTTRKALGQTQLPTWIRPILVPKGTLKTKPRALNYALEFARGTIIGVYDAEDAPHPGQLKTVAQSFAAAASDVACLQGTLDYYNPAANWLTRCFTIEYASWFRVVLPGFARMGLVVPLGGTTLFFRRAILEKLGAWDAHNVTEDADLGVRLARRGYRTVFIPSVTEEEANGHFWPWVKQRSRWLKGYAITYGVHMRNPLKLWRDLGTWRFFGVQLIFLGTLTQFVLAPIMWSFWLMPLGLPHPAQSVLSTGAFWALTGCLILAELINQLVACVGVKRAGKSWLMGWAPSLFFYFPLGSLAVYKGLLELGWKPFYWDKTRHGVLMPKDAVTPPPPPPPHQASGG